MEKLNKKIYISKAVLSEIKNLTAKKEEDLKEFEDGEYIYNDVSTIGNYIFQMNVRKIKTEIYVETYFRKNTGEIVKYLKEKEIRDSYSYDIFNESIVVTIEEKVLSASLK